MIYTFLSELVDEFDLMFDFRFHLLGVFLMLLLVVMLMLLLMMMMMMMMMMMGASLCTHHTSEVSSAYLVDFPEASQAPVLPGVSQSCVTLWGCCGCCLLLLMMMMIMMIMMMMMIMLLLLHQMPQMQHFLILDRSDHTQLT
jgi:hypothetical protein